MIPTPPLARGTVLLARFPTTKLQAAWSDATLLLAASLSKFKDVDVAAVAYGTSRLDEDLLRHHQGLVLSVPSQHIRGPEMSSPVTHFVIDHVALMPLTDTWFLPFKARLDCFKPATVPTLGVEDCLKHSSSSNRRSALQHSKRWTVFSTPSSTACRKANC